MIFRLNISFKCWETAGPMLISGSASVPSWKWGAECLMQSEVILKRGSTFWGRKTWHRRSHSQPNAGSIQWGSFWPKQHSSSWWICTVPAHVPQWCCPQATSTSACAGVSRCRWYTFRLNWTIKRGIYYFAFRVTSFNWLPKEKCAGVSLMMRCTHSRDENKYAFFLLIRRFFAL